ncbi:hypothetical protein HMPREF9056_00422 [Actinomyces sp. oral taxon 170 str. F0386]|nr:hypothetical protein HMPREF9056_00422 [Actinomyces sp. oral taxon 170 str. F0386]
MRRFHTSPSDHVRIIACHARCRLGKRHRQRRRRDSHPATPGPSLPISTVKTLEDLTVP